MNLKTERFDFNAPQRLSSSGLVILSIVYPGVKSAVLVQQSLRRITHGWLMQIWCLLTLLLTTLNRNYSQFLELLTELERLAKGLNHSTTTSTSKSGRVSLRGCLVTVSLAPRAHLFLQDRAQCCFTLCVCVCVRGEEDPRAWEDIRDKTQRWSGLLLGRVGCVVTNHPHPSCHHATMPHAAPSLTPTPAPSTPAAPAELVACLVGRLEQACLKARLA